MYIAGIRIRNVGPFRGEHEISLVSGCYGIIAQHSENKQRSNGLGKSFFVGAIRWALEGIKVEGVDSLDELITAGEDLMGVDLELSDGTFISREKKRGKSTSLIVESGGLKLKGDEAQERIELVLGISSKDRLTTCWAEQKQLDKLAVEDGASLTEMIERWLGPEIEKLIEAGSLVNDRHKQAVSDHSEAVSTLAFLERGAGDIAELSHAVDLAEEDFGQTQLAYESALKLREQFFKQKTYTNKLLEVERLEAKIVELGRSAPTGGDAKLVSSLIKKVEISSGELTTESSKVSTLRVEESRLLSLVKGEFSGACPVSNGFQCPAQAEINSRSAPNRASLASTKESLAVALKSKATVETLLSTLRSSLQEERARESGKTKYDATKASLDAQLAALKLEVENSPDRCPPLHPLAEAPKLQDPPDKEDLFGARAALSAAKNAEAGLSDARKLVDSTAARVRAHALARAVLGPDGARKRVAEQAVLKIEQDANEKLAEAGIGLRVKAVWGRETGSLAEQCSTCGSAFPASAKIKKCESCGVPRGNKIKHQFRWKLSFTSGAGKDLGGLALRIAGYLRLKQIRGASWSVAILDEPTAAMDSVHRRAIAASIRKLLVGTFEQAFISAHDSSTLESCDKKILIRGTGADPVNSTIEVIQ